MFNHLCTICVAVYVGLYIVFLVSVNWQRQDLLSVCTVLRHNLLYFRHYSFGHCLSWLCPRSADFGLQALFTCKQVLLRALIQFELSHPRCVYQLYNQKICIKYMVRTQLYIFTQNSTYNYMFRPCILAFVSLYYKLNKQLYNMCLGYSTHILYTCLLGL